MFNFFAGREHTYRKYRWLVVTSEDPPWHNKRGLARSFICLPVPARYRQFRDAELNDDDSNSISYADSSHSASHFRSRCATFYELMFDRNLVKISFSVLKVYKRAIILYNCDTTFTIRKLILNGY